MALLSFESPLSSIYNESTQKLARPFLEAISQAPAHPQRGRDETEEAGSLYVSIRQYRGTPAMGQDCVLDALVDHIRLISLYKGIAPFIQEFHSLRSTLEEPEV